MLLLSRPASCFWYQTFVATTHEMVTITGEMIEAASNPYPRGRNLLRLKKIPVAMKTAGIRKHPEVGHPGPPMVPLLFWL
jgi:hypothetical protein